MLHLRVRDVLHDKILVTRESARLLAGRLQTAVGPAQSATEPGVVVDFEGVEGMAPSFLDELLGILRAAVPTGWSIRLVRPPASLSARFEAVARGRGLVVVLNGDGSWSLAARAGNAPAPSSSPGAGSAGG